MKRLNPILLVCLMILTTSGCSYLFYPRADEYAQQAKGATAVDTMLNLTAMLETSAAKAKGGTGRDQALDDYHNQLHALFDTIDAAIAPPPSPTVSPQITPPASDLLITYKKTLRLLFHRLWALKDQQPQRDQHLDRCLAELKHLREVLQTLKGHVRS